MSVSEMSKKIHFSMEKNNNNRHAIGYKGTTQACIYRSVIDVFTCTNDSAQLEIR